MGHDYRRQKIYVKELCVYEVTSRLYNVTGVMTQKIKYIQQTQSRLCHYT